MKYCTNGENQDIKIQSFSEYQGYMQNDMAVMGRY